MDQRKRKAYQKVMNLMAKSASNYKIIKRADGRWFARVMVNGETICIYGKTQTEVRSELKQKLWELEQAKAAQLSNYVQGDKLTVRQWALQCLETYSKVSVRGTTYQGYLTILNQQLPGIEDRKLNEVTNVMVQEHLQKLARNPVTGEGLGEKTLVNIKNFLSLIFNYAVQNGMVIRNPVTGVKVPKAGTKQTRALSLEEQNRLLTVARNYDKPMMFAVVFALYTGCRKGEVMGLQWKDVDFEENIIHIGHQLTRHYDLAEASETRTILEVTDTKTKFSVRDIYMFPSFAKEFKAYKEQMIQWKKTNRIPHSEEDFVFVSSKNTAVEPRVFYKYYQDVMKQADVEDCNFHTLRHTFATRCIENGADILMVSRTLGHSNISTTLNKYSHLLPKHQKACMEKLEAIYHP